MIVQDMVYGSKGDMDENEMDEYIDGVLDNLWMIQNDNTLNG